MSKSRHSDMCVCASCWKQPPNPLTKHAPTSTVEKIIQASAKSYHTPAPWLRDGVNIYRPGYSHEPIAVVKMGEYSHEFEANARLITAAPEMLTAFNYVARLDAASEDDFKLAIKLSLKMIAKAEGE